MYFVIDDFIEDFEEFNRYARTREYSDIVNPYDNVTYPYISTDIPEYIVEKLRATFKPDKINTIFFRMSPKGGQAAPHQVHNDSSMGQWTLIYYFQDGPGGTSFLEHKETKIRGDVFTEEEAEIWKRDCNDRSAWDIYDMVPMKANRALVYPSYYMHRAEPVGGFGDNPWNSRLIMGMFFDREITND